MEYKKGSKQQNFIKVRKAVAEVTGEKDIFTTSEIMEKTNLDYMKCRKYLTSLEELGLIKYSETTKIYMRL